MSKSSITLRHSKKAFALLFTLVAGAVLIYAGNNVTTKNNSVASSLNSAHKILKVVDGDTAEVDIYGQKRTVRFIGMDTPEVVDPRKTVQCFGREASSKGHELLEGKSVQLEYDPVVGEIDKYGRTLAYVILPSGEMYNQKMIAEGYAHEYTYQSQVYKYQTQFKVAQNAAEAGQLGLWNPSTCNGDTKQAAK